MHKKKGYTIIEIIVVLALFSVMFCIAFPSMKTFARLKEDKEVREFRRDIYFARNQAIVNNCPYYFVLDYDTGGYHIKKEDQVIERKKFKNIALIRTSQVEFTFSGSGAPLVSGSVNIKTSDGTKYRITVTPVTGKISIKEI